MTPTLPTNPNLQYYKNCAKDLLKAHKRRDVSTINVLRRHEKLKDMTDQEILESKLSLADVQYAYARDYGFKNWAELKKNVEQKRDMSSSHDAPEKQESQEQAFVWFWEEFANLIHAGLPVVRSLRIMADEAPTAEMKTICDCIVTYVGRGESLSNAMKALGAFSRNEIEMTSIALETGDLDGMSSYIAKTLREKTSPTRRPEITVSDLKKGAKDSAPPDMSQAMEALIREAIKERASDIHIEQSVEETHVRFRIDGLLQQIRSMSRRDGASLCASIKTMASLNIAEKRIPQDGRAHRKELDVDLELKISAMPTVHGENVTVRIMDNAVTGIKLAGLCGPEDAAALKSLAIRPHGLVFVTGPAGSGKTTVVYALLNETKAARPQGKLCSVEDPVEYILENVSQTQVDLSIGLNAPVLLKRILEGDPDVVYVSEPSGSEAVPTVERMVALALTGHTVLTSIPAQDTIAALNQVVTLFPQRDLLANTGLTITNQRLLRCLCDHCKIKIPASTEDRKVLGLEPSAKEVSLWKPEGCTTCGGSGYKGRTGVFEILRIEGEAARLLGADADSGRVIQSAIDAGGRSLRQSVVSAVLSGTTSVEEAAANDALTP